MEESVTAAILAMLTTFMASQAVSETVAEQNVFLRVERLSWEKSKKSLAQRKLAVRRQYRRFDCRLRLPVGPAYAVWDQQRCRFNVNWHQDNAGYFSWQMNLT
jgi:hypothetical protein